MDIKFMIKQDMLQYYKAKNLQCLEYLMFNIIFTYYNIIRIIFAIRFSYFLTFKVNEYSSHYYTKLSFDYHILLQIKDFIKYVNFIKFLKIISKANFKIIDLAHKRNLSNLDYFLRIQIQIILFLIISFIYLNLLQITYDFIYILISIPSYFSRKYLFFKNKFM